MKFDHIGVFVNTIESGRCHLTALFPIIKFGEIYNDELLKVSVQFLYDTSGICYEIVAPLGADNPVESVLKMNRNILNHVAYQVDDFENTLIRYRELGCIPLCGAKPAKAFNGSRVIFLLTPLKIIVELIESNNG